MSQATANNRRYTLIGAAFLTIFALLLVWYYTTAFLRKPAPPTINARLLVAQDQLFDVFFNATGGGWVVGGHGLIVHSPDGGKSWAAQRSGTFAGLSAVSFADEVHGFAVGQDGTILTTSDGGRSWTSRPSSVKEALLSVQAISPDDAVAVGAFGELVVTSDGGKTWTSLQMAWDKLVPELTKEMGPVDPSLNGLWFENPHMGWIVGEFGLIMRTGDAGQNWTVQRYGSSMPQLYVIKRAGDGSLWTAGQHGSLLHSIDGGKTWKEVSVGVSNDDFYSLSFDGRQGTLVGNNGLVFTTDDSGTSWRRMTGFPADVWLSGVTMQHSPAVAVGEAGSIFYFRPGAEPCRAFSPGCGG